MSLHELTVRELSAKVKTGAVSPVELAAQSLARIGSTDAEIGAFVEVFADSAMTEAGAAEREIASGNYLGPLHGIPVAVKDIFDVAGHPTMAGSNYGSGVKATKDADCVSLLRAAGAVIVGKTNTHECAFGCTTPTTRNPWNTGHVPGGSSGGSAASIAAGDCYLALGSDTGGSIRSPASHCGIYGLKPTYDLVSRNGVVALSWSLDHVGAFTRSVWDLAAGLTAIVAPPAGASSNAKSKDYTSDIDRGVSGLRIGVPQDYYFDNIHPDVSHCVMASVALLEAQGARRVTLKLPYSGELLATHFCIMFAEASAYHQDTLHRDPNGYGEEVRALLRVGELLSATEYISAQRARGLVQRAWAEMFSEIDALVVPSVAAPASRVGEDSWVAPDGTSESILSAFSRLALPANLLGLPAICIPSGIVGPNLPVGVQVIAPPYEEALLFRIARSHEVGAGTEGQIPKMARDQA